MTYNYYFCARHSEEIEDKLTADAVKYKTEDLGFLGRFIIFNLKGDVSQSYLSDMIKISGRNPIVTAVYSTKELRDAEYLWIQPKKQKIDIINSEEAYHRRCVYGKAPTRVHHLEQHSPFMISKEPPLTGTTALYAEDTGFKEIFADCRVKDLAALHGVRGTEFRPVFLKNGGVSEKLYQLTSTNILPDDIVAEGYGEVKAYCHICGMREYDINNAYQLHIRAERFNPGDDFYITPQIFGEGILRSLYLMSQRFYQLLKSEGLAGGLNISPVVIE